MLSLDLYTQSLHYLGQVGEVRMLYSPVSTVMLCNDKDVVLVCNEKVLVERSAMSVGYYKHTLYIYIATRIILCSITV